MQLFQRQTYRRSMHGIYRQRYWRSLPALIAALVMVAPAMAESPAAAAKPEVERITVDANSQTKPFPHFWEHMFGSGRAILSLRESYRDDLRKVKNITDCRYVRFHAIFHDEVGLYDEDTSGKPIYNFSYVDQIYDGLLATGVRPFVELSFMPAKLASTQARHSFWYHPFVSPPKDDDRWRELIQQFVKHLIARYGAAEVANWYFEVWNEPNLDFWQATEPKKDYYRLYSVTAHAIKDVDPHLKVGGPATAQAAWVDDFIKWADLNKVPVDFVSTHVYGNDSAPDVLGTDQKIPRSDMVALAVRKVYDQVKASPMPKLPIIWSEYNASYMNEVDVTDSPFMGPWLANNIRQCDGLTTEMSLWTFSDVFEEQGVVRRPFYGGYGLIAAGGIPKAAFNAFAMLHKLGEQRINLDSKSAIATKRADGSIVLAVWNYTAPGESGAPRTVLLNTTGLGEHLNAQIQVLDKAHGSALATWEAMGKPDFPTREQQTRLRTASQLPPPELHPIPAGTLSLTLEPQALALIEISIAKPLHK